MDALDDAAVLEQFDRDRALASQAARSIEPAQCIEQGVVWCIDCDTPISPERLKARPEAARCIDCQHVHELREAHGCNG